MRERERVCVCVRERDREREKERERESVCVYVCERDWQSLCADARKDDDLCCTAQTMMNV